MKLSKAQRKSARKQLRAFREENPEEEVNFGRQRKRNFEISNQEAISEMRQVQRERKSRARKDRYDGYKEMQTIREERGPKARISYAAGFQPGDLVTISARAMKKHGYYIESCNLFEGATGVIVDQEDTNANWKSEYEEGRYIQVMGPNGLQQWDIKWVEVLEDEDED